MIKCEYIKNKDLIGDNLRKIINIKQQHWKYPFEEQAKWINDNLTDEDMHVCLIESNDKIIAYLDLVSININIDNNKYLAWGIGNVCVDNACLHNGYGAAVVKSANKFIDEDNYIGVLLCHNELIKFYEKCGWTDITESVKSIVIADSDYYNSIMLYGKEVKSLILNEAVIYIDKNF